MCKKSVYGNCDEETKDDEYCIFHKPNKSKEEARVFWRKFLERFKPVKEKIKVKDYLDREIEVERFVFKDNVDCSGYVFPEIPDDVDFTFKYAIFGGDVKFEGVTFEGVAEFEGAIFGGNAWFVGATFEWCAKFSRAIFGGHAEFRWAEFEKGAEFRWAEFEWDARFSRAIFGGHAEFEGAIFYGYTGFFGATFRWDGEFEGATFKGYVGFNGATFEGDAKFEGATFEGIVTFTDEQKKEICKPEEKKYRFHGKLNFSSVTFRTIYIDLPSECFKHPQAEAEACRVQRISYEREGRKDDADKVFIRERRALRRLKVLEVKEVLKSIINILKSKKSKNKQSKKELKKENLKNKGANLNNSKEFKENLKKEKNNSITKNIKNVLKLVIALWKNENVKWYIKEELEKKELNPKWIKKSGGNTSRFERVMLIARALWDVFTAYANSVVERFLADLTCEYGTNWIRPVILWVVLVIFVFPITYFLTHSVSGIHGAKIGSIWNYLYFSVVTATTLGYGDLHPVGWGKAIASAEAIFGMFMWAVFLAVFSRKYMR